MIKLLANLVDKYGQLVSFIFIGLVFLFMIFAPELIGLIFKLDESQVSTLQVIFAFGGIIALLIEGYAYFRKQG